MFPLYDASRRRHNKLPIITIGLIFFNTLIFFFTSGNIQEFIFSFGMVPQEILQGKNFFSILSAMFLHGGLFHLIVNMWFLFVFGENLEAKLGSFKFLVFYLSCGILAGLFYSFFATTPSIPTIGASGAISGILGGYMIVFPKNKIRSLIFLGFFLTTISIPVIIFLFIWLFYQFFVPAEGVATGAHIIGFFAGIFIVKFFKKR